MKRTPTSGISLCRDFETKKLKVNDSNSNPVKIAAVVVWRVVDSAVAMFEVDDYEEYVHVQLEAALREWPRGILTMPTRSR